MTSKAKMYTQTDIFAGGEPSQLDASSPSLLKLRLCFYGVCIVHYTFLASQLLTIDYGSYENPVIKRMGYMKNTMLTVWMSMMHLLYFPVCFYIDWHELNGRHFERKIKILNKSRHFIFNTIIFPSTVVADMFFWRMWNANREAIVPSCLDVIVPRWAQHGLHSFTLAAALLELVLVPRHEPRTSRYHQLFINFYLTAYLGLQLWVHHQTGFWPYPFLATFTPFKRHFFEIYFVFEYYLMFYMQWLVADLIWGHRKNSELAVKR